jgi:hypothetical protein
MNIADGRRCLLLLLKDYWIYLIQGRNNEVLRRMHREQRRLGFERKYPDNSISGTERIDRIDWIESLVYH